MPKSFLRPAVLVNADNITYPATSYAYNQALYIFRASQDNDTFAILWKSQGNPTWLQTSYFFKIFYYDQPIGNQTYLPGSFASDSHANHGSFQAIGNSFIGNYSHNFNFDHTPSSDDRFYQKRIFYNGTIVDNNIPLEGKAVYTRSNSFAFFSRRYMNGNCILEGKFYDQNTNLIEDWRPIITIGAPSNDGLYRVGGNSCFFKIAGMPTNYLISYLDFSIGVAYVIQRISINGTLLGEAKVIDHPPAIPTYYDGSPPPSGYQFLQPASITASYTGDQYILYLMSSTEARPCLKIFSAINDTAISERICLSDYQLVTMLPLPENDYLSISRGSMNTNGIYRNDICAIRRLFSNGSFASDRLTLVPECYIPTNHPYSEFEDRMIESVQTLTTGEIIFVGTDYNYSTDWRETTANVYLRRYAAIPRDVTFALNVSEGSTIIVKATDLNLGISAKNTAYLLTVSYSSYANAGYFHYFNSPDPITEFSGDDLINNTVAFTHNGSESKPTVSYSVSNGIFEYQDLTVHFNYTPVNDPPTLHRKIPLYNVNANKEFTFSLENNTFFDPDSELRYHSDLTDCGIPRTAIHFNPDDLSFSGKFHDIGNCSVTVTATDQYDESANDTFVIEVTESDQTSAATRAEPSIFWRYAASLTNTFISPLSWFNTVANRALEGVQQYATDVVKSCPSYFPPSGTLSRKQNNRQSYWSRNPSTLYGNTRQSAVSALPTPPMITMRP